MANTAVKTVPQADVLEMYAIEFDPPPRYNKPNLIISLYTAKLILKFDL